MYVCVCNAITEDQLRQAIAAGAKNLDDLREALGLGDQCGKCLEDMRQYFSEEASVMALQTQTYIGSAARSRAHNALGEQAETFLAAAFHQARH